MRIGSFELKDRVFAAPMAGVTDRPFRRLCRRLGAAYVVSEMVASDPRVRASGKTSRRLDHEGESAPIAVQLVGADPAVLADAARYNVDRGAQIIDLNMGCPARKVCQVACGSALLKDEALVARILQSVVAAVDAPVTLKYRTGWDPHHRNAVRIARVAESAGIRMLTLHGRTRACGFMGRAEYDTIAQVKQAVRIPVVANGDIDTPQKAHAVFSLTGADAIMIGRAAQGRPWIFREIGEFLRTGSIAPTPTIGEVRDLLQEHLDEHYGFYGEALGVRTARKHIIWYTRRLRGGAGFCERMNRLERCEEQRQALDEFLRDAGGVDDRLQYADDSVDRPPAPECGGDAGELDTIEACAH
ncbi:MAG TPA: tRNA dihydrouridine synthase DusB [Burkholderiaceae bacterium]|jgi:tRNA-dihydrouridine synthase B|nr:tRNA dihydrouridine synthase DusB [Burkholderiaceae bacterium]